MNELNNTLNKLYKAYDSLADLYDNSYMMDQPWPYDLVDNLRKEMSHLKEIDKIIGNLQLSQNSAADLFDELRDTIILLQKVSNSVGDLHDNLIDITYKLQQEYNSIVDSEEL